jgi:SHS2 domain-containing protein
MPFELFEHTADLGLRVRAPSLERLCAEGARGLTSVLVVAPEAVLGRETRRLALANDDAAELWREWLAELAFLFAARGFVVASCSVAIRAGRLDAEVCGESFDERRHGRAHEVKAVTYHALRVVKDAEGWLGEAILDI